MKTKQNNIFIETQPTFLQNQQWEHQNNVRNLFRVYYEDTRAMSMLSF